MIKLRRATRFVNKIKNKLAIVSSPVLRATKRRKKSSCPVRSLRIHIGLSREKSKTATVKFYLRLGSESYSNGEVLLDEVVRILGILIPPRSTAGYKNSSTNLDGKKIKYEIKI